MGDQTVAAAQQYLNCTQRSKSISLENKQNNVQKELCAPHIIDFFQTSQVKTIPCGNSYIELTSKMHPCSVNDVLKQAFCEVINTLYERIATEHDYELFEATIDRLRKTNGTKRIKLECKESRSTEGLL